jgi:RNA polymerase sigma factor (sigma-70 family)
MKISPKFTIDDDDLDLLHQFTAYISKVVGYARLEYFRKMNYREHESPLEDDLADDSSYDDPLPVSKDEFTFAEDRLTAAFSKLNLLRRQILKLIFVDELSAQEVAERLNCSVDYVYLQKHRALKALRDQLMEGGDERGE